MSCQGMRLNPLSVGETVLFSKSTAIRRQLSCEGGVGGDNYVNTVREGGKESSHQSVLN